MNTIDIADNLLETVPYGEAYVREQLEAVTGLDSYRTIDPVVLPNSWQVVVPETGWKVRVTRVSRRSLEVAVYNDFAQRVRGIVLDDSNVDRFEAVLRAALETAEAGEW